MIQKSVSLRVMQICATGVSLALAAIACSPNPASQTERVSEAVPADLPRVVVTTSVLCDLTQQVAADTIALTCLLSPGQDPHTYQAKPSDRQALDEADLVLYDGYGFMPSMIGLVEASNHPVPKIAVYEAAVPNPLRGTVHDHDHDHDHEIGDPAEHDAEYEAHRPKEDPNHGDEDHSHGDEDSAHTETMPPTDVAASPETELVADPHIWHNARNNRAMVEVIANQLTQINPDQADVYETNAAQLTTVFTALDQWIQTQVDTIPADNRKLVTTHDAFRYFADAYGVEVKGALGGLTTAERPSAQSLTALVDQVKAARVPAIFAESTTNPELINAIAKDANVSVAEQPLFVEGPGTADSIAPTMPAMLVANTCTIVNALGGRCNPADAPR
jgi:manganese/iron transport system substrate-binding protein